jgi:pilus assembly protein CpaC
MRLKTVMTLGAMALTLSATWMIPMVDHAEAQEAKKPKVTRGGAAPLAGFGAVRPDNEFNGTYNANTLIIPAKSQFPMHRRIALGKGKSLMIQFPVELRDVMVSDPETVDAVVQSSDRVFLVTRKAGSVNAFFFDGQGNKILTLEIAVGSDLSVIDDILARLIPGSKIKTETAGSAIILTGSVKSPADSVKASQIAAQFTNITRENIQIQGNAQSAAQQQSINPGDKELTGDKRIINLLQVESEDQVMLKVTIAEIQRSVLKQFGINIGTEIANGNFATSLLTQNGNPLTAAAGLTPIGNVGAAAGLPYGQGCVVVQEVLRQAGGAFGDVLGNSGAMGRYRTGNACISHTMRALERHGLAHTLAEPNLTAVSGESARFLSGGEYPIPVAQQAGTITVEYKPFGVGLAFTPTVLSEGRISLKIDAEVSELTNEGAVQLTNFQIPALRKRTARSVLELPSGGSMVMAGLISENTRKNVDGFPGLKDLPVLGALFRSRDYIKGETELVIIVTPYVVKPTARQNLGKPRVRPSV